MWKRTTGGLPTDSYSEPNQQVLLGVCSRGLFHTTLRTSYTCFVLCLRWPGTNIASDFLQGTSAVLYSDIPSGTREFLERIKRGFVRPRHLHTIPLIKLHVPADSACEPQPDIYDNVLFLNTIFIPVSFNSEMNYCFVITGNCHVVFRYTNCAQKLTPICFAQDILRTLGNFFLTYVSPNKWWNHIFIIGF